MTLIKTFRCDFMISVTYLPSSTSIASSSLSSSASSSSISSVSSFFFPVAASVSLTASLSPASGSLSTSISSVAVIGSVSVFLAAGETLFSSLTTSSSVFVGVVDFLGEALAVLVGVVFVGVAFFDGVTFLGVGDFCFGVVFSLTVTVFCLGVAALCLGGVAFGVLDLDFAAGSFALGVGVFCFVVVCFPLGVADLPRDVSLGLGVTGACTGVLGVEDLPLGVSFCLGVAVSFLAAAVALAGVDAVLALDELLDLLSGLASTFFDSTSSITALVTRVAGLTSPEIKG